MIFDDPGVIAAFSRQRENMSLNYGLTQGALDNRKNFLNRLNIDYRCLVCPGQSHSVNIRSVTKKDKGSGALSYASAIADTDALITNERNLPLAVFTADCLSVFLYDPLKHVIGLVHAGWKGTADKITAKAVALMQEEFGTNPAGLLAGFGPAIRQCCYEVSKEFKDCFAYGLEERNGGYFLDLAGINQRQLVDSGLRQENIYDCRKCTFCRSDDFFSFRREGVKSGRMISVIMLK